ncbi:MAG: hypothetical protein HZB79_03580 [Deltaproteobacteria bacterium]|nr:hypothetical protein [Deltaproteobacteria bacterium]
MIDYMKMKAMQIFKQMGSGAGFAPLVEIASGLKSLAMTTMAVSLRAKRSNLVFKMGCVPVFTILFMLLFIFRVNTAWALTDPPPDVASAVATSGQSNQVPISWTINPPTCGTDAYGNLVILRNTASIIDKPGDGSTYAVGAYIGASKVVRSVSGPCPPATSPWTDTGLLNGQKYYYKIFTGSTSPNYKYSSPGVERSATPSGVVTTKGTGTILRRTSEGDNTCGGPNNACHNLKTHNSANTESQYWSTWGGWGTASNVRYGKFVCQTCHQPHSTKNIYLISQAISFPDGATNPDWPVGSKWATVDYRYRTGTSPASYVLGDDSDNHTTSSRVCEVCHSQTKYHRYNTTNQLAGNKAHNNAALCTECHSHQDGFKPGEGGPICSACHSAQTGPMSGDGDGTRTYHMVMQLVTAQPLTDGIGYNTRYPNKQQPAPGDTHRNCLYCHVEMENYSKKANKSLSSQSGRAYNLRKTILRAPSTTVDQTQLTNMDFLSDITTPYYGGICTSCHMYAQTKDTTNRTTADKTINTPEISPTSYKETTHNYYVDGGGYISQTGDTAPDATTFKANCTKCHNDTLAKKYQPNATYKFGLHDSELRRLNAPMSLATTSTGDKGADKGTVTAWTNASSVSLTADATWTTNAWRGRGITISAGTGTGQTRIILSNTQTVITVSASWSPVIAAGSFFLLGDPIEEEVCFRCHSTSTTSNPNQASYKDFYNTKTFTNTRAMKMEQVFGTSNPYGHLIANYSGLHRADEVIAAPPNATSQGWFSNTGTGKHVGCTDCHNPHAARKPGGDSVANAAQGNGTVTTWDNTATASITETGKTWTANQWRGYVLRILSGSGAGQDRMIMSNNANTITVFTSWETFNLPSTTSFYIISPLGHPQYGNLLSNVNDDAWGVTIASVWPTIPLTLAGTAEYMPTQLAGTFFTKTTKLTGNSDKIYNLCFKCHSAYGWGTSGTPFTIPDAPTSVPSNMSKGVGPSADIAARFNPNNLAHHAVYSKGKNQPIIANYGSTTAFSYYNSAWPYWGGPVSTYGTITITSGTATLTVPMVDMINSRPLPVLPGWFVWIGTQDLPNVWSTYETAARRGNKVPGTATSGWFEITSITSLTQFQVTPAVSVAATSGFAITAGFGNTMVPPYGPWSVISCADCHDTDSSTDPSGPHASARPWILRKFETQDFPWYNGTSVIRIRYTPPDQDGATAGTNAWTGGTYGANTVCVNCHRADVYGIQENDPEAVAGPGNDGRYFINMNYAVKTRNRMSRQPHCDPQAATEPYDNTLRHVTGINCMLCHAGGGGAIPGTGGTVQSAIGEIHGTSIGKSLDAGALVASASYRGKRFLVGGVWEGVIRGSVGTKGTCYLTSLSNSFVVCGNSTNGAFGNLATYDYESGTDY